MHIIQWGAGRNAGTELKLSTIRPKINLMAKKDLPVAAGVAHAVISGITGFLNPNEID
jgi:hypothetical protein